MKWRDFDAPEGPERDDVGRLILNPGDIVIRVSTGERFLVGHINQLGGHCDDCLKFQEDEEVELVRVNARAEEFMEWISQEMRGDRWVSQADIAWLLSDNREGSPK